MYTKTWTQFETQSLAFSILRKQIYPKYLVRGDQDKILVYSNEDQPRLQLTIEVAASTKKGEESIQSLSKDHIRIVGGNYAYNIVELTKPYLKG